MGGYGSGQRWGSCKDLTTDHKKLEFLIAGDRDRIHFFRLDPRQKPVFLGIAKRTGGSPFIIT